VSEKERGTGPIKVGDVVDSILDKHGVRKQVRRMEVLDLWASVVGEHVARVTRAKGVSDATLFVEVRTSAWLMELNMMKGEFLERVNALVPETPLERIVFVLAETE
jgi:predicted nucleic acid-binding Zn ribbon protein